MCLALQLHLRRVGVEPRPDLIRGAPKPTDVGNPSVEKQRGYDDHRDVGSSRDQSEIEQMYDNAADKLPENDEQEEVHELRKGNKESCKGPLGGDEREDEDEDDPAGDDGGFSRGLSKKNEAENTKEPLRDDEKSSKNSGSTNADDNPKDSEINSSNEQLSGNHVARLLNKDPQNLSSVIMFSELVLLSYMLLPTFFGALYITCSVHSCRCR